MKRLWNSIMPKKKNVNKAAAWAILWDRLAPPDVRQLPTKHAGNGGELLYLLGDKLTGQLYTLVNLF